MLLASSSRVAPSSMQLDSSIASQKLFHAGECIRVGGEIREGIQSGVQPSSHRRGVHCLDSPGSVENFLAFVQIIELLFSVMRKSGKESPPQVALRWHGGCGMFQLF